jgi:hypothetical protein
MSARIVLLVFALGAVVAACNNVPATLVDEATRPKQDAYCVAALARASQCDPRFPDRTQLCAFTNDEECAPYLNAEQVRCIRAAPCDAVRAAVERGDWLCGVSLAGSPTH